MCLKGNHENRTVGLIFRIQSKSADPSNPEIQTIPDLFNSYIPDGLALSPNRVVRSSIYAQTGNQAEIQTPTHWNVIGWQPAACVIAQQYSFATFLPLSFHSRTENFKLRLRTLIVPVFIVFDVARVCNCLTWSCITLNVHLYLYNLQWRLFVRLRADIAYTTI